MMSDGIENPGQCPVNRQCSVTRRTACKHLTGIGCRAGRWQPSDCDSLPRGNLSRGNMSYFINENNQLESSQLLISATS